jgi:hypothetical protein
MDVQLMLAKTAKWKLWLKGGQAQSGTIRAAAT